MRSYPVLAVLALSLVMSGAACVADGASEAGPAYPVHPDAAWFVQTGCTACHSISVYRVTNVAAIAPDLSLAVEDVPKRFGRSLDEFLREPTGTMAMVLGSRIRLTDAERSLAIEKLKAAHAQHLREKFRLAVSH